MSLGGLVGHALILWLYQPLRRQANVIRQHFEENCGKNVSFRSQTQYRALVNFDLCHLCKITNFLRLEDIEINQEVHIYLLFLNF